MSALAPASRLALPQVTLLAVTSVNVSATLAALEASMTRIAFGAAKLLTNCDLGLLPPGLEHVPIAPLRSAREYSEFVLTRLADHVATSHALLVQWDGHVLDARHWRPEFLEYDFLGASWPQFSDGWDVGNGGFSLRSRRLIEACCSAAFKPGHPEDLAISRTNRHWLEAQGLRFAPRELADAFSAERAGNRERAFGFHGVWHMPAILGPERFWNMYCGLEDRTSVYQDLGTIMEQIAGHRRGWRRCLKLGGDKMRAKLAARRYVA
jgi:hypothetical protein